ncbi:1-hydroxycarotenoid 3,4-desaturase CrtD [Mangrovibacterium diazotrophicum]|uniref:Phytoene desaturase n=1 Tax=Mangrovibacterium diazotrophicum TaxID=1261403 RepID=A0A419W8P6_9BACT|nr:1-hydroxycarotenoid 3,4-desaturase CrtD [Mangrovibacterium diazotrophicum]RKD91809.1 phytoene desaturase [Mangrovibacterium diazotrophicum]
MKNAGVIGAGIGGLAVAIRLARMGWKVVVYEKAEKAGGKLNELQAGGFRFDKGPSLFTLPHLLDELLDDDLRIPYRKLDVVTRYFYEDGSVINAYADPHRFAKEVSEKTSDSSESVLKYLKKASFIYRVTATIFIFSSFHRLSKLITLPNLWRALQLPRIQALAKLHRKNKASFSDPRLVQLFDRFATYNGSNPYEAPATLQVIAHLEHNLGAYFPDRGMYAIATALQKQAERSGVEFHFTTPVQKVLAGGEGPKALLIGGQQHDFDLVVSDVDVRYFYDKLLMDVGRFRELKKQEPSSSAMIFYWGMKRQYQELDLHNIFFSENYANEFECLFRRKTICDDPTVYVYVSSKQNPDDAPPEMENWFVMVNAPVNSGQNWQNLISKTRKQIVLKLERMLKASVNEQIVAEHVLDPLQIESLTSSVGGAIYGASSNSLFAAFRRHPNVRKDLPGVYFVGGSVHPGGGIPLCLASAKIAADLIKEKEGSYA